MRSLSRIFVYWPTELSLLSPGRRMKTPLLHLMVRRYQGACWLNLYIGTRIMILGPVEAVVVLVIILKRLGACFLGCVGLKSQRFVEHIVLWGDNPGENI